MQRQHQFRGGLATLALLVVLVSLLAGCGDDTYAACSIDNNPDCRGDEEVSCVETESSDCDSQVCARYRGSEPFCTTACDSDDDCVAGECVRIEFLDSTSYCVEETDVS